MKTSVIEVGGMLSALSSHGVEQQLGKLKGVYSETVNCAAANATVRYDETQVTIADIKAPKYTCGYQANESLPTHVTRHKLARTHRSVVHGDTRGAHAGPAATPVAEVSATAVLELEATPASAANPPAPMAPLRDAHASPMPGMLRMPGMS